MKNATVLILRIVLVFVMAGCLVVQWVMVPLWAHDLAGLVGVDRATRVAIVAYPVLILACLEVTLVCVWQLVTLVHRGTLFSVTAAAFRWVDPVIGAIGSAAVLTFGLCWVLAPGTVAPGVVWIVGGVAVMIAGAALIAVILKRLLEQAVAREQEARRLRAELDEVV